MLAAFVHERVAAGRDVPAEVWDVIDRHPPADELAAIEAERSSEFADRRAGRRAGTGGIMTREASHEDLRAACAHDLAHDRRLRGDGRVGREGARRAGVLARPAAQLGRARSSTTSTRCSAGSASAPRSSASATTARSGSTRRRRTTTTLRREVLALLPRYLAKDGVVAVGEIGYDAMTPAEDEALRAQLDLAREFELPALVHTPHRDKLAGHARTLELVEETGHRAGDGADRPQQRADRAGGPRVGLLGRLLDLPEHEDGRVPHGADPRGRRDRPDPRSTRPATGACRIR